MKKWVNATLTWIAAEKGGRKTLMGINVKYCPIIVFEDLTADAGDWSAEIYIKAHSSGLRSSAHLSFLAPNAPFELLRPGAKFVLYEGAKPVAKGVVPCECIIDKAPDLTIM